MRPLSIEKKYLVLFFVTTGVTAASGNYWSYLTTGPDIAEESFTYGDFNFKSSSNLFTQTNQMHIIGDFIIYEIEITSNLSEPVIFQHSANVKFLDTVIHSLNQTQIKLSPNKVETIKVVIPIEHESLNHITHNFSYYYENESGNITNLDSRTYSELFLNTDQSLVIMQYAIILKYLWVLAIPLILGSIKATHDLFAKTVDNF